MSNIKLMPLTNTLNSAPKLYLRWAKGTLSVCSQLQAQVLNQNGIKNNPKPKVSPYCLALYSSLFSRTFALYFPPTQAIKDIFVFPDWFTTLVFHSFIHSLIRYLLNTCHLQGIECIAVKNTEGVQHHDIGLTRNDTT